MSEPAGDTIQGLLTVDLEDWFHANYDDVDPAAWEGLPSTVLRHTNILLEMFQQAKVKATFFSLGCVAEKHPQLMCAIRDAGHEIACHGYGHQKVSDLGPAGFREDLKKACNAIETSCGVRPKGFRAPSWSISPPEWADKKDHFWALRILHEQGFEYDASLFPFKTYLYGVAGAPLRPHRIAMPDGGELIEIPAAIGEAFGQRVPFGGGFYFRLFPLAATKFLSRAVLRKSGGPVMFYIHPREISPDQPRLKLDGKERFIHYYNLKANRAKMERLLKTFRFGTVAEYLRRQGASLKPL